MQQYADEKGIAYLDLNEKVEELGLNWAEDTQDKGDHLNVYGAEKVTSYLGNYLEDNYELKIIEMIRLMKHGISWRNSTSKILQRHEEK